MPQYREWDEEVWDPPETEQAHARLELANELVQLSPFTAYVRTATTQHHVALHPPAPADIDERRIEQVRQASKARFGRPSGPPAPALGEPQGPSQPPPTSPGIARKHTGEE